MNRRSAASRVYVFDSDLDAVVEVTRTNRDSEPHRGEGLQIVRDIDAYKTIAHDVAVGAQTVIGGRRQHREFLKRNGYFEVGNDAPTPRPQYIIDREHQASVVASIKRALGE